MKNRARIFIAVLAALTMLFSFSAAGYAGTKDAIHVSVNLQLLDQGAVESQGIVFLPLRAVCETLGWTVEWSEENRSVTVKNEDKTILFDPKAATITDAGHSYFAYEGDLADNDIGAGCIFTGGRIYTASETLASCLGMKTALDQTGNTLALTAAPLGNVAVENKKICSDTECLQRTSSILISPLQIRRYPTKSTL